MYVVGDSTPLNVSVSLCWLVCSGVTWGPRSGTRPLGCVTAHYPPSLYGPRRLARIPQQLQQLQRKVTVLSGRILRRWDTTFMSEVVLLCRSCACLLVLLEFVWAYFLLCSVVQVLLVALTCWFCYEDCDACWVELCRFRPGITVYITCAWESAQDSMYCMRLFFSFEVCAMT